MSLRLAAVVRRLDLTLVQQPPCSSGVRGSRRSRAPRPVEAVARRSSSVPLPTDSAACAARLVWPAGCSNAGGGSSAGGSASSRRAQTVRRPPVSVRQTASAPGSGRPGGSSGGAASPTGSPATKLVVRRRGSYCGELGLVVPLRLRRVRLRPDAVLGMQSNVSLDDLVARPAHRASWARARVGRWSGRSAARAPGSHQTSPRRTASPSTIRTRDLAGPLGQGVDRGTEIGRELAGRRPRRRSSPGSGSSAGRSTYVAPRAHVAGAAAGDHLSNRHAAQVRVERPVTAVAAQDRRLADLQQRDLLAEVLGLVVVAQRGDAVPLGVDANYVAVAGTTTSLRSIAPAASSPGRPAPGEDVPGAGQGRVRPRRSPPARCRLGRRPAGNAGPLPTPRISWLRRCGRAAAVVHRVARATRQHKGRRPTRRPATTSLANEAAVAARDQRLRSARLQGPNETARRAGGSGLGLVVLGVCASAAAKERRRGSSSSAGPASAQRPGRLRRGREGQGAPRPSRRGAARSRRPSATRRSPASTGSLACASPRSTDACTRWARTAAASSGRCRACARLSAWALSVGANVTVAVIDSGANLGHEDLPCGADRPRRPRLGRR